MVVQCPGCETKYNIPIEKMGKGSTQLRCSRCGKQFTFKLPEEKASDKGGVDGDEVAGVVDTESAESSVESAESQTQSSESAENTGSEDGGDEDSSSDKGPGDGVGVEEDVAAEASTESSSEAESVEDELSSEDLVATAARAAEVAVQAAEAAAKAKTAAEVKRLADEAARAAEAAKKAAEAVTHAASETPEDDASAAAEDAEAESESREEAVLEAPRESVDPFEAALEAADEDEQEEGESPFTAPASEQTTEIDADALEFVDDDESTSGPPATPPTPPGGAVPPPAPEKARSPHPSQDEAPVDLGQAEPSRETAPVLKQDYFAEEQDSIIVDPSLSSEENETPRPKVSSPPSSGPESWELDDGNEPAQTGSGIKVLGVIMLILLVLGGGVLLYVFVLQGGESAGPEGVDTQSVEFVMSEREGGGQVLMVRGRVVNISPGAKQHISVRAQILEPGGAVVREKQAPCGRTWTAGELTRLTSREIAAEYERLEQSDRMIPPNGEITCSVVFEIIPSGFSATSFRPRLVVTQAESVIYNEP